jgi:alkaline phosphatase D
MNCMCKTRFFLLFLILSQISVAFAQQDKPKSNGEIKKKSPTQDVLIEKSSDAEQIDLISIPVTKIDTTQNITTIAFGSCNKHLKPQTMWDAVATNKPDLWIWLGDIIYADTTDMKALAFMYKQLKTNPEYKKLTANTPVVGVYDDHDFGANDAGKGYPMKKSSKKILMDFLNIPANAAVRKREGAYQSYTFGKGEQKVKVIVMDTRYFRDTLLPDESKAKRYIPNLEGDILGEAQWKWLEKELKSSAANFTLLCSSIQVISDEHPHEKWGNFPNARKRLLTLIVKTKPKNLMILSGDRHMAEISKMDLQGLDYPLYDFTSSGMTHIRSGSTENNKFRVGDMIIKKNFGLLKLSWDGSRPTVSMQVRTHGNELLQEIITKY